METAVNNVRVGDRIRHIHIADGVIAAVSDTPRRGGFDAGGLRAVPGLVDIHAHGAMGHDTMDADFAALCDYMARHGTTSWLPTTMTESREALQRVARARRDVHGAHILGIHLEGPYIAPGRRGAQNPAHIRRPDAAEVRSFPDARLVTVAPEVDGALDFIRELAPECVIALGHTDCDETTARAAFAAGARSLTHIFNAMPPFLHRAPGPIGAALTCGAVVQLIGDGLHVAPSVVLATCRAFGPDHVALISDSIRPAGLPDGTVCDCGGLKVALRDGQARLPDGTLAGSTSTLWQCVRRTVECGVPFDDAVRMATRTPADLLNVRKGRLEPGYDADILLVDDSLALRQVFLLGEAYPA